MLLKLLRGAHNGGPTMKPILIAIFLLFGDYTLYAFYEVVHSGNWVHMQVQVLLDLVLACLLAARWMVIDARESGRNPLPYLLITLVLGSFGPLLYLLLGGERDAAGARAVAQRA